MFILYRGWMEGHLPFFLPRLGFLHPRLDPFLGPTNEGRHSFSCFSYAFHGHYVVLGGLWLPPRVRMRVAAAMALGHGGARVPGMGPVNVREHEHHMVTGK